MQPLFSLIISVTSSYVFLGLSFIVAAQYDHRVPLFPEEMKPLWVERRIGLWCPKDDLPTGIYGNGYWSAENFTSASDLCSVGGHESGNMGGYCLFDDDEDLPRFDRSSVPETLRDRRVENFCERFCSCPGPDGQISHYTPPDRLSLWDKKADDEPIFMVTVWVRSHSICDLPCDNEQELCNVIGQAHCSCRAFIHRGHWLGRCRPNIGNQRDPLGDYDVQDEIYGNIGYDYEPNEKPWDYYEGEDSNSQDDLNLDRNAAMLDRLNRIKQYGAENQANTNRKDSQGSTLVNKGRTELSEQQSENRGSSRVRNTYLQEHLRREHQRRARLEHHNSKMAEHAYSTNWACPCNKSYVSFACCDSPNGLVWEPANKFLGAIGYPVLAPNLP